jgi:hypothetical protein
MNNKIIVVEDRTLLLDLTLVRNLRYRVKKYRIALNLGLNPREQTIWEERLNLFYGDCGCDTGAFFTLTGLVLYFLAPWFIKSMLLFSIESKICLGLAVMVIFAVTGKIAGFYLSGKKFKSEVIKFLSMADFNPCQNRG